jgi:hypothetical protein
MTTMTTMTMTGTTTTGPTHEAAAPITAQHTAERNEKTCKRGPAKKRNPRGLGRAPAGPYAFIDTRQLCQEERVLVRPSLSAAPSARANVLFRHSYAGDAIVSTIQF